MSKAGDTMTGTLYLNGGSTSTASTAGIRIDMNQGGQAAGVLSINTNAAGMGLNGQGGLYGVNGNGTGTTGIGVRGISANGTGVYGYAAGVGRAGVHGGADGTNGTGVAGFAGGVGGVGVYGESPNYIGVLGNVVAASLSFQSPVINVKDVLDGRNQLRIIGSATDSSGTQGDWRLKVMDVSGTSTASFLVFQQFEGGAWRNRFRITRGNAIDAGTVYTN